MSTEEDDPFDASDYIEGQYRDTGDREVTEKAESAESETNDMGDDSDGIIDAFKSKLREKGVLAQKNWIPYEGPQGGTGWKNTDTGDVTYDDEPPGGVDEEAVDSMESAVQDQLSGVDEERLSSAYEQATGSEPSDDISKEEMAAEMVDSMDDHEIAGLAQNIGASPGNEAIGGGMMNDPGPEDDTPSAGEPGSDIPMDRQDEIMEDVADEYGIDDVGQFGEETKRNLGVGVRQPLPDGTTEEDLREAAEEAAEDISGGSGEPEMTDGVMEILGNPEQDRQWRNRMENSPGLDPVTAARQVVEEDIDDDRVPLTDDERSEVNDILGTPEEDDEWKDRMQSDMNQDPVEVAQEVREESQSGGPVDDPPDMRAVDPANTAGVSDYLSETYGEELSSEEIDSLWNDTLGSPDGDPPDWVQDGATADDVAQAWKDSHFDPDITQDDVNAAMDAVTDEVQGNTDEIDYDTVSEVLSSDSFDGPVSSDLVDQVADEFGAATRDPNEKAAEFIERQREKSRMSAAAELAEEFPALSESDILDLLENANEGADGDSEITAGKSGDGDETDGNED